MMKIQSRTLAQTNSSTVSVMRSNDLCCMSYIAVSAPQSDSEQAKKKQMVICKRNGLLESFC